MAETLRMAVVVELGPGFPEGFGSEVILDVVFEQHSDEDEFVVQEKIEVSQRSELVFHRLE